MRWARVTTGVSFLVIALALVSTIIVRRRRERLRQRRRQGGLRWPAAPGAAAADGRPAGHRAARRRHRPRRDRSRDHRRHRRQDRGQWLRQRLHPRLRDPGAEAAAGRALQLPAAEVEKRVAIVMSGGTEGGLSPHLLVFCREAAAAPAAAPRLAIGVGLTRAFAPEEIGRARADRRRPPRPWRRHGGGRHRRRRPTCISSRSSARCSPRSASRRRARRGAAIATEDTYHSMALSRGASALGVALALGEVDRAATEAAICRTGRSIPASPAPRPASSCCATRSSCWATPPAGPATW